MQLLYVTTPRRHERPVLSASGKANPFKTGISFDLIVGGPPNKDTCKAHCEHCFFRIGANLPGAALDTGKNINERIAKEKEVISDLRAQGYSVTPYIADTFAWGGKYLESGMLQGNALYSADELSTTGVAWTSGLTLLNNNKDRLLDLAWENNLRLVGLSSYGIDDGEAPLKGVVKPSMVRKAVKNIQDYNCTHPEKKLDLSISFPIGAHNIHLIRDYIVYAALIGADYIRLNRLIDFSRDGRFRHLVLSSEQRRIFFMEMRKIEQERFDSIIKSVSMKKPYLDSAHEPNPNIKIMISTDFGFDGEEALERPEPINRCRGGISLFAILSNSIYACLELAATGLVIGKLVLEDRTKIEAEYETTITSDKAKIHTPVFDVERVRLMHDLLDSSEYRGCFADFNVMSSDKMR